jgi:hypothetical protein
MIKVNANTVAIQFYKGMLCQFLAHQIQIHRRHASQAYYEL